MIIKHSSNHGHMGIGAPGGGWLRNLEVGGDVLTLEPRAEGYDAMLCWWEFTQEFLDFQGPKVFYCCEPSFYFRGWRRSKFELRKRLRSLRSDEFAWHYHPHPLMRVEHESSDFSDKGIPLEDHQIMNAASVLNNLGSPFSRNPGRQRRAEFVVESGCDIFGPVNSWERFRINVFSKAEFPPNYKGECPVGQKLLFLSKYHACVCLENSCEPFYFTEKFPDAVRAGCVPIYHAHPTVKEEFLQGAVWVDPGDYGFDAQLTMEAALKMDRSAVADTNTRWLNESGILERTSVFAVYKKLAGILNARVSGRLDIPERAERPNLMDGLGASHGRQWLNQAKCARLGFTGQGGR